jgi:apolipoprotein N-acyltransferase
MAVDSLPMQRCPVPMTEAAPAPRTRGRASIRPLLAPLASAGLLYLCHFPVAWGWLAWVAFVPLLSLVHSDRRARAIYWPAFLGGLACYVPMLQWFRVADPRMIAAWLVVALYCSLFWPFALLLLRLLDRRTRLPLVLTAPVVWTSLEYLRAHAGGGFSWYQVGYTQHTFLHIIQIADVTGVPGVSFLILAVNGFLAEVLLARPWWRTLTAAQPGTATRFGLLVRGLAILGVLLGVLAYGDWRLRQSVGSPGPRLALLQGNVPQQIRNDATASGMNAADYALYHYIHLADLAAHPDLPAPDLMVWPETSWPDTWFTVPRGTPPHYESENVSKCREMARTLNSWWKTSVLLGANTVVEDNGGTTSYNSAHLIGPDGIVADRYDKIHRVPLGEYVPLRDSLPFLKKLAPYDFDYSISEGQQYTNFHLVNRDGRSSTFGVVICYEDSVPEVVTPYGGGGSKPADFVLNISNDGWFDGTAEHDEHLAVCRFRAIENRRTMARAVNMGISAVIDSSGRILRPRQVPLPPLRPRERSPVNPADFAIWEIPDGAGELPLSEWHLYKKHAGVLIARIPVDDRTSLYTRLGDWVAGVSWFGLLAGCGLALFRPRPTGVA